MSMLASVKSLGRRRYAGSISVLSLSGVALAKTDAASVVKNNSCLCAFVANILSQLYKKANNVGIVDKGDIL